MRLFSFGVMHISNTIARYFGTPLEGIDKVKYLLVLSDEKMQWKYQIRNIAII